MKKVTTAAFALSAMAFAGTAVTAQAEKQTTRPSQAASAAAICTGLKSACLPSSLERIGWANLVVAGCDMAPGAPGLAEPLIGNARPSCEKLCKFKWEQCMKTGFWEGLLYTAQPNAVKS